MQLQQAQELFRPLNLEQALAFLDVLTWFPEAGEDRWAKVDAYVTENAPVGKRHSPDDYRVLHARVADALGSDVESAAPLAGRWKLIEKPKKLYELKYNLKALLYAEDWFTFMNMGFHDAQEANPVRLEGDDELWRHAAQLYHHVASQVPLRGKDVLEVGSGRGGGASFVTRHHRPESMVGIDYCPNNIAFASRRHQVPGLRFERGDAEALHFADESFDAIINIESAHCYPNVDRFLSESRRVLRRGGHLLMSTEWWRNDLERLDALVAASGLELVRKQVITQNVIQGVELLKKTYPALLAAKVQDPARRGVWERFFGIRVCEQSGASYTTGRFDFLTFVLRKA
jgi:2-polyprenyl-3-methyl-5-hydroxy-6-metoxy-1,4-benzoquinol methylase